MSAFLPTVCFTLVFYVHTYKQLQACNGSKIIFTNKLKVIPYHIRISLDHTTAATPPVLPALSRHLRMSA